jgi:hypothetical protein
MTKRASYFLTSPVSSARADFSLIGEVVQLCAPWLEIQERLNQVSSLLEDVLARQAACVKLLAQIADCQPPAIVPPPDAINLMEMGAREQQAGLGYYVQATTHISTPGSGSRLVSFCPVLSRTSNVWNLFNLAEDRFGEAAQYYAQAEQMLLQFKNRVCRGRSGGGTGSGTGGGYSPPPVGQ